MFELECNGSEGAETQPRAYFWLASHTSLMLEKRWWCSVLVMVSLSSAEFLNMRIRISRLCRYECSEEMTSKIA